MKCTTTLKCRDCSKFAEDGRTRCRECHKDNVRKRNRQYNEKRAAEWKAKGLCSRCGKTPPGTGAVYCDACKEAEKKRGRQKIASGLCGRCGITPTEDGYVTCLKCRATAREKKLKKQQVGVCYYCPRQVILGLGYCEACRTKHLENQQRLKEEVFAAYGGFRCNCCGETERDFLTLDHINQDGAVHRRQIGNGRSTSGTTMYRWLKRNNFPEGFQVLCYNCNCSRSKPINNGVCPHQKRHAVDPLLPSDWMMYYGG